MNRFYDATFTLVNSAGSATSNTSISELLAIAMHNVISSCMQVLMMYRISLIDYIENTEALGALLALMYLDQDGNIVCNQSIYYATIRSEDNLTPPPMGDSAMTNSYMGLAYDIEGNGLEDNAYPAVRRHVDIGSELS